MTISAKIIADSISISGSRITTFELEYPRFIHSEFLTHRLFSRNAASSRAIPVPRAIELIKENTAMPIHWGKNRPGMSAKEECDEHYIILSEKTGEKIVDWNRTQIWNSARDAAIGYAEVFNSLGYHKQIVNRLLEPFTHIKVVLTATELDNWFWLRNHEDAQPEIHELARQTLIALDDSVPVMLTSSDWHVPYFEDGHWISSDDENVNHEGVTLQDAIAVSSSCAAQVSYRRLDDSVEKARSIYERLIVALPPHFSPMEHQAKPMAGNGFNEAGVTHLDRYGNYWSGNFNGWVQNRQLMMINLNLEAMTSAPKHEV